VMTSNHLFVVTPTGGSSWAQKIHDIPTLLFRHTEPPPPW
jgi:hypothetical protein